MIRRQATPLKDRWDQEAKAYRALADKLVPCPERDALLEKARQAETASSMYRWLPSLRNRKGNSMNELVKSPSSARRAFTNENQLHILTTFATREIQNRKCVRLVSGPTTTVARVVEGAAVEDLEKTAAQLMTAVRNLPPGQQRQDAMKEIGRLRNRMYEMLRSAGSSQSVVENDAATKRST